VSIGVVLTATLLVVERASFRERRIERPSPPAGRQRVVITTDAALTTGCRSMREITLSGAADGAGDAHSEEDRDRDLEAIATAAGANFVLVLERRSDLIHGRAYRCPDSAR
jgi:hypothetical protein